MRRSLADRVDAAAAAKRFCPSEPIDQQQQTNVFIDVRARVEIKIRYKQMIKYASE